MSETRRRKTLKNAKLMAQEYYDTWGQWVVECYTDKELQAELDGHETLAKWVATRKSVAAEYKEILDTAW